MNEVWKNIDEFKNLYIISNFGNVISLYFKKGKLKKQCYDKDGYLYVGLCFNGKVKSIKVHRLVATAFIPNPYNKPQVNHKDGNKQNNCIDNLEWVTHSENHKHAFKMGLKNHKGINHPYSKLSENDVLTIHGLYLSGMSQNKIGKIYEIHQVQVSHIVIGKNWNHLIMLDC